MSEPETRVKTVRLTVTGRVQGVGYRMWVEAAARALGLRGWVRNRRDGSVEIVASGDVAALVALEAAARNGPPAARVAGIDVTAAEDDCSTGFTTRPTV